ncbi:MAG: TIGR04086 family membrane protein [Bacillota bacterium]
MKPPRGSARGPALGPMLVGTASGLVWTLAVAGLVAFLVCLTPFSEAAAGPIISTAAVLATVVAGFVAGRRSSELGWFHGAGAGLLYAVATLVLGAVAFSSRGSLAWTMFKLAMGTAGGIIGGVMGINSR